MAADRPTLYRRAMLRRLVRSRWTLRALGVCVGLLPAAILIMLLGWGPTGNDNVGEWYLGLAVLAVCPTLAALALGAILVRTRARDVGVGLLATTAGLIVLWVVGVLTYAAGLVPPGMDEARDRAQ